MISIKQYIIERLENTQLFEMAYGRAKYIDMVTDLLYQLIENWCLCRYCSLYDKDNINRNHWQNELTAYIHNLQRKSISTDKHRATYQAIIEYPETNNSAEICKIVSMKWDKEHFDIESNETMNVCRDCAEYGVFELVDIISDKNSSYNDIKKYVSEL